MLLPPTVGSLSMLFRVAAAAALILANGTSPSASLALIEAAVVVVDAVVVAAADAAPVGVPDAADAVDDVAVEPPTLLPAAAAEEVDVDVEVEAAVDFSSYFSTRLLTLPLLAADALRCFLTGSTTTLDSLVFSDSSAADCDAVDADLVGCAFAALLPAPPLLLLLFAELAAAAPEAADDAAAAEVDAAPLPILPLTADAAAAAAAAA